LLVVPAVVSAMKHRTLIVTSEKNIWWVRLDGVEVVSFSGPHAQEWAYRERIELEQLLDAQSGAEPDEQHESDFKEECVERAPADSESETIQKEWTSWQASH
jgi:hypothetical protein